VLDNRGGVESDYPRSVAVSLSTDGTIFGPEVARLNSSGAAVPMVVIGFPTQGARAVRLSLLVGDATDWWSIHEVRVACTPIGYAPGLVDPYDAAGWKVTASSMTSTAARAVDQDLTTRWTSGGPQTGTEWIRIDLGAEANISQVTVRTDGADIGAQYKLDLSTDDFEYGTVAAGVGAPSTLISFAQRRARFVRISQTGRDPAHWWAVNEITIRP
jgi:hypothetical protein